MQPTTMQQTSTRKNDNRKPPRAAHIPKLEGRVAWRRIINAAADFSGRSAGSKACPGTEKVSGLALDADLRERHYGLPGGRHSHRHCRPKGGEDQHVLYLGR